MSNEHMRQEIGKPKKSKQITPRKIGIVPSRKQVIDEGTTPTGLIRSTRPAEADPQYLQYRAKL